MWFIITLASLTAVLIFILCVPIEVALRADVYGKPKFRLKLSWFYVLVRRDLAKREKKVAEKRYEPETGKTKLRDIIKVLRTRGLLSQLKYLVKDVLSCFKIRNLIADFTVGLGDPADTGLLFAFAGPAASWLNSSFPCHIRIRPSFEDEGTLEGYSHGVVRLRPIRLVIPALRFAFSPAAMRTVKKLVLTKLIYKGLMKFINRKILQKSLVKSLK